MTVHHNILFRLDAAIKADFVRVKPKVNEASVNDYVQVTILVFQVLGVLRRTLTKTPLVAKNEQILAKN